MPPALRARKTVIRDMLDLFGSGDISPDDLDHIRELYEDGRSDEAMEFFRDNYLTDPTEAYTDEMSAYLAAAASGEMSSAQLKAIRASAALLSAGLAFQLTKRFRQVMRGAAGPAMFKAGKLGDAKLKRDILARTIDGFKQRTAGALARTGESVLTGIRSMQTEMIVVNQRLARAGGITRNLTGERDAMRELLRRKLPQIMEAADGKSVILDRAGRRLNVETYLRTSVDTTMLNAERDAAEVAARSRGREYVEYLIVNPRGVKEEREICREILNGSTFNDVSLLALNPEAAAALDVMFIETARQQTAMGVNCRHGIRQISNTLQKRIDKELGRVAA